MTAKELMTPRFEVIADYPNLKYNIGRILSPIKEGSSIYDCEDAPSSELIMYPEKYPHLFRKLNWWENRISDQMPKRVMSIMDEKRDIYDIEEWDMEILVGWIDKKERSCCSLLTFKPEFGYVPVD